MSQFASISRRSFVTAAFGLASTLALAACGGIGSSSSSGSSAEGSGAQAAASATATAVASAANSSATADYSSGTHHATIAVEDYGTITVELDADTAPITVANFAKLVNEGFYDGLTFHRIISGFMIQGGDPNGDGTGGSSETIVGEFEANGYTNDISHLRGTISMARSSAYDSASSQFFIMHADYPALDGQYAAFGHVTEGMEVVDAIVEAANPTDSNGTIEASQQPVISSIRMLD